MGKTWVCHKEPGLISEFMELKHTDSSVKKKFWALRSVKKSYAVVFLWIKGPVTIDFLGKDATVNNDSYYQLFR